MIGTLRSHDNYSVSIDSSASGSCASIQRLIDPRTVILSPPTHTFIASRMTTQQDLDYNQMFLNTCVLLLDGL